MRSFVDARAYACSRVTAAVWQHDAPMRLRRVIASAVERQRHVDVRRMPRARHAWRSCVVTIFSSLCRATDLLLDYRAAADYAADGVDAVRAMMSPPV